MCNAITKKGSVCKNKSIYNGKCQIHASDEDRQIQREIQQRNDYNAYLNRSANVQIRSESRRELSLKKEIVYQKARDDIKEPVIEGFKGVNIDSGDWQNVHTSRMYVKLLQHINDFKKLYDIKVDYKAFWNEFYFYIEFLNNELDKIRREPPQEFVVKEKSGILYKIYKFFTNKVKYENHAEKYVQLIQNKIQKLRINIKNNNLSFSQKLLVYVLIHIRNQKENRFLLSIRLLDEYLEGMNVCEDGKCMRYLNVFSGVTNFEDPRSENEKIQDEMARISKLGEEFDKVFLAQTFLDTTTLSEEEKQVWIEAL